MTKQTAATADPHRGRVLDWEGCLNARDLGGLATSDGSRIRWGALVRSDQPTDLTEAGRQAAVDHGVRTVIDVRRPEELARDKAYPLADLRRHVSFHRESDESEARAAETAYALAKSRAELNILDIDLGRAGIAAAVGAIADAPAGAVLVHCAGGKDRTGAIVAMVLALLGVSDDDIADDYALTSLHLEPIIAEWLDSQSKDPAERDRLRALAMPAREAMLDTLRHVREHYGSAGSYLRGGGVTDDQLDRLRARLLESAN